MTDKRNDERIKEISKEYCVGDILARVLFELEEKGIAYKFAKKGEEYCKLIAGWEYTYSIEVGENKIDVSNIFTQYEDSYIFEPDKGDNICLEYDDPESEIANCVEQIIALLIEDN
jgi:hypothetical protein